MAVTGEVPELAPSLGRAPTRVPTMLRPLTPVPGTGITLCPKDFFLAVQGACLSRVQCTGSGGLQRAPAKCGDFIGPFSRENSNPEGQAWDLQGRWRRLAQKSWSIFSTSLYPLRFTSYLRIDIDYFTSLPLLPTSQQSVAAAALASCLQSLFSLDPGPAPVPE